MSHKSTLLVVLLIFVVVLAVGCVPLRSLGPAKTINSRTPEILLSGPYEPPEVAAVAFSSSSDHLRDLNAGIPSEVMPFNSTSDHLRDLYAGIPAEAVPNNSTSDILRGVY